MTTRIERDTQGTLVMRVDGSGIVAWITTSGGFESRGASVDQARAFLAFHDAASEPPKKCRCGRADCLPAPQYDAASEPTEAPWDAEDAALIAASTTGLFPTGESEPTEAGTIDRANLATKTLETCIQLAEDGNCCFCIADGQEEHGSDCWFAEALSVSEKSEPTEAPRAVERPRCGRCFSRGFTHDDCRPCSDCERPAFEQWIRDNDGPEYDLGRRDERAASGRADPTARERLGMLLASDHSVTWCSEHPGPFNPSWEVVIRQFANRHEELGRGRGYTEDEAIADAPKSPNFRALPEPTKGTP